MSATEKSVFNAKTKATANNAKKRDWFVLSSIEISATHGNRYRENSAPADKRLDLLESCISHKLIELPLSSAPHYPGLAFPIPQYSSDHFQLWVPRLAGIDEIATFFNHVGDSV